MVDMAFQNSNSRVSGSLTIGDPTYTVYVHTIRRRTTKSSVIYPYGERKILGVDRIPYPRGGASTEAY